MKICYFFISILYVFSFDVLGETRELSAKELNDISEKSNLAGNYKKAYQLAIKAEEIATEIDDLEQKARAIKNRASTQYFAGDNQKALMLYTEALSLAKKSQTLKLCLMRILRLLKLD